MATLAQILALLPDNTTGDISAQDVRDAVTALWHRTDGTASIEGLQFDITATPPAVYTPGHLHYNTVARTLDLMTGIEGNTLQLGQEQYLDAFNITGTLIPNGSPVRITGGQDEFPIIGLDNALGTVVGVATVDIPSGEVGRVTTYGLVHNLDTQDFPDGVEVFATAFGTLTTSESSSRVGFVTHSDPTEGVLFVLPDRRTIGSGLTSERPVVADMGVNLLPGFKYFDTDLGYPIFWNGLSAWVDATGVVV
jgi:predicted RecA/RadA family phage recombinase